MRTQSLPSMAIKKQPLALQTCVIVAEMRALSQDNSVEALAVCLELLLGRVIVFKKSAHRPTVRNTLAR